THQGMQGGLIQMVNHGLSTGALFLIVGMIYERRHSRMIADFGGLAKQIPIFTTFFMIVTLSSIGLPGLNGFVGEFLVLLGTFKTNTTMAILATSGVIFAAVYMLWMFKRMMFGPLDKEDNKRLKDLSRREIAVLVPFVVFIVLIGVYAQPFLGKMEKSVDGLISHIKAKQTAVRSAAFRPSFYTPKLRDFSPARRDSSKTPRNDRLANSRHFECPLSTEGPLSLQKMAHETAPKTIEYEIDGGGE
ncbi:MAG: NuoM family protein, partial [bacterium]